eukprot:CAMPEP_0113625906 /NCGR_PEP_ID=MMETSP0017_2-20120614/13386_1 /TAXON_ID=2856 /ORGANISM="Cylindrotheca closterium" /LENGTH=877 /DNA_ID=CAMNT_0000536045 /DNA_START=101 /DNA_END=2731 /DNA_ORIENTATION=+ /assembly_acc=CAM_ASM_000147
MTKLSALRRSLNQERRKLLLASHQQRASRAAETRLYLSSSSSSSSSSSLFGSEVPAMKALSSRLEESFKDSIWFNVPRKGTGFDNFFPNDKKEKEEEETKAEKDSNEETSKKEGAADESKPDKSFDDDTKKGLGDAFDSFRSQQNKSEDGSGGSSNNNNNGVPPNFSSAMMAGILMMAISYAIVRTDDDNSPADFSTREITWNDFCNHLLETGQVEKIVVTNNRTQAKVYLKPGSKGLPPAQPPRFRYAERRQQGADSAGMDTMNSTESFGTSMPNELYSRNSFPAKGQKEQQIVYRFAIGSVDGFEKKLEEAQRVVGMGALQEIPVQYTAESSLAIEVMNVIPSLLLMGAVFYFMRFAAGSMTGANQGGGGGMGGIFKIGKSTAKKISKEDVKVNFSNVAGCDEAKKEIMEFVAFLKEPARFTNLGAKIPKGALLCGPPGTGKTLLAKAVAGEAGVPFFSISGSDFIEMFVGVGPSRVRDLFKEARENSPCIIFIDEIDAVGRQRGRGGVGGNDERENTLNQLLVEMDGFNPSTGVVVLAGTNRVDILDQALTRPGRFDRQITVDKPDLKGRKEIFKVHLDGITLEDDVEDVAGRLAGLTPGFAGADIANICNEAAIQAARRKGDSVNLDDFEKATDRIIGGLESNKIMSKEERSIVAHHEAGHAIAGWFLEHADPLLKVTIIPRTSGALGFAQYLPKEVNLQTQDQIMDIVCMALGGRAAEEIFFGGVTTGASDDLRRVTDMVYSTIQVYGMNPRLGQLAFPKDPNAMFDDRPYSEKTAKAMDEEAKRIVDEAYQRTLDLLTERKEEVEKVATLLLDKETITHDDVLELVGPRPYAGNPEYDEFIRRRKKVLRGEDSSSTDDVDSESEKPEDPPV